MEIKYLEGDATKPVKLSAYIVHIVNTAGGWGAGFVISVTNRFGKNPESSYRLWHQSREDFRLGKIQCVSINENVTVVNMVAQSGYLSLDNQHPLNLKALQMCLKQVYAICKNTNITVHMPRIGCGLAGGNWSEVEPIIKKTMTVDTYVYDYAITWNSL